MITARRARHLRVLEEGKLAGLSRTFKAGRSYDWPATVAGDVLRAFENKLTIFDRLNYYTVGAVYAECARSLGWNSGRKLLLRRIKTSDSLKYKQQFFTRTQVSCGLSLSGKVR